MADIPPERRDRDEPSLAPDPVVDVYKRDVDRSLLREQLGRTIDERVRRMIAAWHLAAELSAAGRRERR